MKKWRPTPPNADFWASVIMAVTGCNLTLPSEIHCETPQTTPVVTLDLDAARAENREAELEEISSS